MKLTPLSLAAVTFAIMSISACSPSTPSSETAAPEAPTTAAERGKAYVSNQDGGISVIDLNTLTTTSVIDVKAEGPRGLAVTEDGKFLVVATRENGSVSVIDTATNEVVKQIEVGKNPEFVRIRGNLAFVSYEPSSKGGPPPAPGSAAAKAAEAEDDDEADEPARIGVIDLTLGKKVREIIGGPETEGIEFSADGTKLVITNEADNTVTIHNIETGDLIKSIPTKEYGDRPRGVKVSPDGKTYVVTLEYGNKFMVLDTEFNVVKTVDTGVTPYGIAFDRKGERIFVAANKAKTLEVYDAKTYAKIKDIPTGNRCWHFTFTPDDKEILLACGKSDSVFVIDSEKLEVTKQIEDKKMPWGVVTYPKSMGSLDKPI
jgi:YVTN family beta-propeller protein